MSTIKLRLSVIMMTMLFFMGSCNFINEDINIDPNNPTDVPLNLLLPGVQVAYAYTLGGDFGRYTTIWMQQHAGVERQHTGYEVYQVKENDINNAWNIIYSSVLSDSKIIIDKAGVDSPHYVGVAKVIQAMVLGNLVDLFSDVPWSEALEGAENLSPKYDNGADLYNTIQTLLDEGITALSASESVLSPGSNDLVFAGDLTKWVAAANTLKARYYLRLGNNAQAINTAANGIASSDADAELNFGAAAIEANPWAQFEEQRGDVAMGGFMLDLMNTIEDPRRTAYATTNDQGVFAGAAAGIPDNSPAVSRFGPFYGSRDSPVPLVTHVENKFIEAEAKLASADAAGAAAAHNAAIIASLASFGVSDADFETAQASEDDTTINLEKIITHKYLALYTQQEPFADWRRTGIPALQPAQGETQIGRRFPYPGDERLYNTNYPGQANVFERVFWDN